MNKYRDKLLPFFKFSKYKVIICDYFGVMCTPMLFKLAKIEWDYGVPR